MSKIIPFKGAKRKSTFQPEFYMRKPSELHEFEIESLEVKATRSQKLKVRRLLNMHGLWWAVVIDENGAVISGWKVLKTLTKKSNRVPVVMIPDLTFDEKKYCRLSSRNWESDHGLWFV